MEETNSSSSNPSTVHIQVNNASANNDENIIDIIETANTAINSRKSLGVTLKKYVKNPSFSISPTWRINKLIK